MPVAPPACFPDVEAIEVSRPDKSITDLHVFSRPMPRNGGNDVFLECPDCRRLRRALLAVRSQGTGQVKTLSIIFFTYGEKNF
jgi:hypothetical protein